MSVKKNLADIRSNIKEVRASLEADAREAKMMRSDFGILEHEIAEAFKSDLETMMQNIARLSCGFKKAANAADAETEVLRQQTNTLIKDKILLQEHILNAATRVSSAEEMLGFDKANPRKFHLPGLSPTHVPEAPLEFDEPLEAEDESIS